MNECKNACDVKEIFDCRIRLFYVILDLQTDMTSLCVDVRVLSHIIIIVIKRNAKDTELRTGDLLLGAMKMFLVAGESKI